MKFLFLTDEFYPRFGANSLIVKTISEQLVKKGNEVFVAPFNYPEEAPKTEEWQGIKIVRGVPADSKSNFFTTVKKLKLLTAFKLGFVILLQKLLGPNNLRHKQRLLARGFLENLINQNEIDVVVSINCSVEVGFPILYLKRKNRIKAKWVFYMLDPFESHEYYRNHHSIKFLRSLQNKIMQISDKVFATSLIFDDVKTFEKNEILSKIEIVEFPKIEEPIKKPTKEDILLDNSFINVVCTGSKNEMVRNSEYTLSLCKKFENENVKFYFIGYGWAEEKQEEGNIVFYPPNSWQAVRNMQLDADFLLNIGNTVTNQLPSKVLEYISSGKPIINIYKSNKCPTLSILEDYDALNISENDDLPKSFNKLKDFLTSEHKNVVFEEIKKNYEKYTPEFVANQFLNI